MHISDEDELIRRLSNNDRGAFEQIFRTYYTDLCKFCLKYVRDEQVAEEVVQEVFIKLYSQNNKIDSIKSWLYKVLYNEFINVSKRENSHAKYVEYEKNHPEIFDSETKSDKEEVRQIVLKTINNFPEREKALLLLYHEGMSYSEMAEILEINPNSVGKTLSRAIEKLTFTLKIEYNELFV